MGKPNLLMGAVQKRPHGGCYGCIQLWGLAVCMQYCREGLESRGGWSQQLLSTGQYVAHPGDSGIVN